MTEFDAKQTNALTEIREMHLESHTFDTHFPVSVCSWMGQTYFEALQVNAFVVNGGMSTFDVVFVTRDHVDAAMQVFADEFDMTWAWEGDALVISGIEGIVNSEAETVHPEHAIVGGVDTLIWRMDGGWCWNSIRRDLDAGYRASL